MGTMSTIVLPPRAQRRGLSEEAYLVELEASRRWKREHAEQNRELAFDVCVCGNRKRRTGDRCWSCYVADERARRDEKRRVIAEMWIAGAQSPAIAGLGTTSKTINCEIARMRRDGWSLPLRRPDVVEHMRRVGSVSR